MDISTEPSPLEVLAKLAEASKAQRLAPADEEHAANLMKGLLAGGRAGINSAIEPLLALPWIVGVNAIIAAWPELTLPMRRHLLASLAKDETEASRRLRLSLARAVFKLDPAAGLKIAVASVTDMKDPETGALPSKNRQIFFNVFIGKGKPWLLQLPLGELKGADADCFVHCAIETFPLCPPLSQLSILRWASGSGRFKKLAQGDIETATKAISRWNAKLQRQLKTDIADLPEAILSVLKPEALEPQPASEASPLPSSNGNSADANENAEDAATGNDAAAVAPRREASPGAIQAQPPTRALEATEALVEPSRSAEIAETEDQTHAADPGAEESEKTEAPEMNGQRATEEHPVRAEQPEAPAPLEELVIPGRSRRQELLKERRQEQLQQQQQPRPPREDRQNERQGERPPARELREPREVREPKEQRKPFDFRESVRGLEAYVAGLRSELEQTKTQLRRREEESKRTVGSGRNARVSERADDKSGVDVESLARYNAQLEGTVRELKHQLEDLANHHEAVAESRLLHTDEPLPEGSADQLKTLLSIKLQESYATYQAMRLEPLDTVFRLDYRDLLGTVFDALLQEGVALKKA